MTFITKLSAILDSDWPIAVFGAQIFPNMETRYIRLKPVLSSCLVFDFRLVLARFIQTFLFGVNSVFAMSIYSWCFESVSDHLSACLFQCHSEG